MSNPTRVVTGEVRLSYVNLLKPRESSFGGDPKYSVTLLIPKSDFATKQRIDAAIEAAKELGRTNKWNGVVPPMVATPVHDGDGVKTDGTPFGEECRGHWVLSASSSIDQPPKIVDINLNPILDPTEVYSGMFARVAINFAPYFAQGKKGIGCYLSTNVQKTRDGEPLGASAPAATEDFGGGQAFPQQPVYQQPVYQQSTYQQAYQQAYQQPGVNQAYPLPPNMQQGPVQPTYQQPQQFDPITGQPISGVYGL